MIKNSVILQQASIPPIIHLNNTISGTVNLVPGYSFNDVRVNLTGNNISLSLQPTSQGAYTFDVPVGSYTISVSTVLSSVNSFSPSSIPVTFTGVGGQTSANNNFTPLTYTVSGTLSGVNVGYVNLSLTKIVGAYAGILYAQAKSGSQFTFTNVMNGAYDLKISDDLYFTPSSIRVTVAGTNITGQNFNITGAMY
jgi:hypothetical protein